LGWLVVSLNDLGETMLFVDTAVFFILALYAFTAAAVDEHERGLTFTPPDDVVELQPLGAAKPGLRLAHVLSCSSR
jgi:hypothetical protein